MMMAAALRPFHLLRPAFRVYEKIVARRSATAADAGDGLPMPPPELLVRVAGTTELRWFVDFGRVCLDMMATLLAKRGVALAQLDSVLDFGCGCGRVLRQWSSRPPRELCGTDYDPDMVAWCRANLPFVSRVTRNELEPPLACGGDAFDFAYAISVFTHLSEDLANGWIDELHRVMKPGGYLYISTHGATFRDRLTASERERFDGGELVVRFGDVSGSNLCSAYHPEEYVRTRLGKRFEVVDFVPAGTFDYFHHDGYLLRKPLHVT